MQRLEKNLRVQIQQKEGSERRVEQERITNQAKKKEILAKVAQERQIQIYHHREVHKQKWDKIQEEIRKRARLLKQQNQVKPRIKKRKKKKKPKTETIADIIKNFDKDLSKDSRACKKVMSHMNNIFEDAKSIVLYRSLQIISNISDIIKENNMSSMDSESSPSRSIVAFADKSKTVGESSYDIDPLRPLKTTKSRLPTPVCSFTSIADNSTRREFEKSELQHLCDNELTFIEHIVVKFKHELNCGMDKLVFAAIEAHFEGKVLEVRPELLRLDRNFLACQMAKGILSFAANRLNYEATIKLCISAMASEVISLLRKQHFNAQPELFGWKICDGRQRFAPIERRSQSSEDNESYSDRD